MTPKQNLDSKLRAILTLCTETALDGARTGRYPVPSVDPTAPRKRSGSLSRRSPLRSGKTASNLNRLLNRNRDQAGLPHVSMPSPTTGLRPGSLRSSIRARNRAIQDILGASEILTSQKNLANSNRIPENIPK